MEKPNITPAPWEIERDDFSMWIRGKGVICNRTICSEPFSEEHAKAISAVPEMIQELLAQRRVLHMQLEGLVWLENQNVDIGSYVQNNRQIIEARLKCNKKALIKAGCYR